MGHRGKIDGDAFQHTDRRTIALVTMRDTNRLEFDGAIGCAGIDRLAKGRPKRSVPRGLRQRYAPGLTRLDGDSEARVERLSRPGKFGAVRGQRARRRGARERAQSDCSASRCDLACSERLPAQAVERQASAGARDGVKGKRNDLGARAPLHALVRCRSLNVISVARLPRRRGGR
jgi:hypothetical protein